MLVYPRAMIEHTVPRTWPGPRPPGRCKPPRPRHVTRCALIPPPRSRTRHPDAHSSRAHDLASLTPIRTLHRKLRPVLHRCRRL